jgi:D-3-phosphoglycerate dehydrogenase
MASRYKALVSLPTTFQSFLTPARTILERHDFQVVERWLDTGVPKSELLELIADMDGFIVGLDIVDEEVIAVARKLQVLSKHGIGTDNLNIPAATKRGIVVTNTPGSNASSVADFAMGLLICLARKMLPSDASVRRGELIPCIGPELEGKTLGLIGLGNIGKKVASRALAFGMRVIAYDIIQDTRFTAETDVTYVSKDDILRESHFISIHAPLTPTTRGMIGLEDIQRMRDGAYLINTARGGIVDEAAVAAALASGKLAGAAFDAFSVEPPPPECPLFRAPNIVVTAHMAGSTPEAIQRAGELAAWNIVNVVNGRQPLNALNPETCVRLTSGGFAMQ